MTDQNTEGVLFNIIRRMIRAELLMTDIITALAEGASIDPDRLKNLNEQMREIREQTDLTAMIRHGQKPLPKD